MSAYQTNNLKDLLCINQTTATTVVKMVKKCHIYSTDQKTNSHRYIHVYGILYVDTLSPVTLAATGHVRRQR